MENIELVNLEKIKL